VLLLEPGADPDGLTAAVGAAAEREGIAVAVLSAQAPGEPPVSGSPLLAQIPMTVRLQLLAERFAGLRRQDPDTAIVGAWADPALWRLGLPAAE
jgi:glucosamine--fructose-6-phosphate aminotransferase (isomerizing)